LVQPQIEDGARIGLKLAALDAPDDPGRRRIGAAMPIFCPRSTM